MIFIRKFATSGMHILKVLRSELLALRKCVNHHTCVGSKLSERNPCSKLNIIFRTTTDDTKLTLPKPLITDKLSATLKKRDKISNEFTMIYRIKESFYFRAMHVMILATSLAGPVCLYLAADKHDYEFPLRMGKEFVLRSPFEVIVFVVLVSFIVISSCLVVSRFPLRMYCNKQTGDYIAVFPDLLIPWKTIKMNFKKGDVTIIPENEMWFFQMSSYKIKEKKVILNDEGFERPMELENMIHPKSRQQINRDKE